MTTDRFAGAIDAPFSVPFVHRLRFTHDVFGADQHVLADLLKHENGQRARVQFWVDANVLDAQPDLRHKVLQFCDANSDGIERAGNLQVVPGGEEIKNDVHILERMLKIFNVAELDRRSYVVVIGGGAVLDTVGFAAAIAHRGLRLVRLPTTTLSQDDSGVGVKNGINLFQKKNWLGAFAAPWAVINDVALLETLSDRDFVSGFSEAVKVSLLKDASLFAELCENATRIQQRDMAAALPIIRRSAELHLEQITRGGDPFEVLEARPLDYGHWSAHKLEAMSEFRIRHGEAVAIGVAIDTIYSSLAFDLPGPVADQVVQCLIDLGIQMDCPELQQTETLFEGLEEFRQHLGGRLTLTMLNNVGDPFDVHEVDRDKMCKSIARVVTLSEQAAETTDRYHLPQD